MDELAGAVDVVPGADSWRHKRHNRDSRRISRISKCIIPGLLIARTSRGVKGCKRKDLLIEDNITRDINTTRG
jgi:hypothetical protein